MLLSLSGAARELSFCGSITGCCSVIFSVSSPIDLTLGLHSDDVSFSRVWVLLKLGDNSFFRKVGGEVSGSPRMDSNGEIFLGLLSIPWSCRYDLVGSYAS